MLPRNAYLPAGAATLVTVLVGTSLLALPIATSAFWPFFSITRAADNGEPPVMHDSSIAILEAAKNSDPNPEKGENSVVTSENTALMANTGPEGTVADIEHRSPNRTVSTYTVKPGDSFSTIAAANGISVNTILWANNLTSKSTLKPGQTLVILPVTGIEHTVRSGESVASLAKKYGGEVQDILSYNDLNSNADLKVGMRIIIPDGELAASAPAKTATTAAKPKTSAAKSVSLPNVGGFSNPLPGGRCSQSVHGNNGIDMSAPQGTPIYAAAGGSVIVATSNGGWNGGFGNYVVINHANGTQTLYAHMSSTATSVGASVGSGELIGYVGRTGKSTGNHLHFEVHKAANPFCR